MRRAAFRKWFWVHKWSSLLCTIFLLLICVTGLPLIFSEEIEPWLDTGLSPAVVVDGAPKVSLDRLVALSRKMYPGHIIISIYVDDSEPKVNVYMAPSLDALRENRRSRHWITFDAHTARVLKQTKATDDRRTFLGIMLSLHRDLFVGFSGELFMGLMGLLFVVAIVSGIALYGPFMRKLDFGTLRVNRSMRLKWLDVHNLLGVVTLAWGLVVGTTGVINELSKPMFALWQQTDVKAMLTAFNDRPGVAESDLSSVQAAFETGQAALPEMVARGIVFPGTDDSTPYHYVVWTKGRDPLRSRLFSPVLVDARSGKLEGVVVMPWYLRALELSRPLHFGDYGGLPMKIIWALLDLVTMIVLGSGLYLWLSRGSTSAEPEVELIESYDQSSPLPSRAAE